VVALRLVATLCPDFDANRGRKGPIARWTRDITSAGFEIVLVSVFIEGGLADWSLLTILLATNGAWCSHESQTETGHGGSLPYVRCKTGRKMRT